MRKNIQILPMNIVLYTSGSFRGAENRNTKMIDNIRDLKGIGSDNYIHNKHNEQLIPYLISNSN